MNMVTCHYVKHGLDCHMGAGGWLMYAYFVFAFVVIALLIGHEK